MAPGAMGRDRQSNPYEVVPAKMIYYNKVKKRDDWNCRQSFSAQDIRFTQSKDRKTLYATALNWPEDGKIVIKNLKAGSAYYPGEIRSVSVLGSKQTIKWNRTAEGLEVTFPKKKPCEWAFALKIQ